MRISLHSVKMHRYVTLLISFLCLLGSQAQINPEDLPTVIIIGSGPAALAAGAEFFKQALYNVTILEAEDRIGGRLYTKEFGGYPIDLGAQWVHGEENNAVFDKVWSTGLLERSSSLGEKGEVFNSAGDKMTEDVANDFMSFFFGLENVTIPQEFADKSLGDWFNHELDEYFKAHPEIKPEDGEALKKTLNLMQMALEAADDWYDVGTDHEYEICAGDQMINWKDKSYGFFIDIILRKYPYPEAELPFRNKTILNAEVKKIDYSDPDGKVRVTTEKGDQYVADHVIVTPSLGVLKAEHETMFHPALPEKKVNAIKKIGFGSVAKIFLHYTEPWWPSDGFHEFIFYWTDEDENKIANDPEKSWLLGVYGILTVEHKPNLLCVWVTGKNARQMEAVAEEKVFDHVKELLQMFLGKSYNLTEPKEMIRSTWYTNKHFRGTYSHRSPETNRLGIRNLDLAEPIMHGDKPVVMFAGEATSPHQSSTVHGAVQTGRREALRILNYFLTKVEDEWKKSKTMDESMPSSDSVVKSAR